MIDGTTREAFKFFHEHAGWATPPGKAACALELARAERLLHEAETAGVAAVEWQDDPFPYDPGSAVTEEEAGRLFESGEWTGPFWCSLTVDGECVESLGGIVVGPRALGDPYCRVIAAQLASEAEDEIRQALGDARDGEEAMRMRDTFAGAL